MPIEKFLLLQFITDFIKVLILYKYILLKTLYYFFYLLF